MSGGGLRDIKEGHGMKRGKTDATFPAGSGEGGSGQKDSDSSFGAYRASGP